MKKILCKIGIHNWKITKYGVYSNHRAKKLIREGFERECEWCEKQQRLEKPKEYHPTAYVWTNVL